MNRYFALLFTGLALALGPLFVPVSGALAANDNPKVLEYIDAQVEVFAPMLETYQDDYFAANGTYFQALASHSSPPEGDANPDGLPSHPTDQAEALADLWDYAGLPASVNWSFRVDTYDGPDGPGYVLTVGCSHGNDHWQRSINYGPESYRTVDWFVLEDE
jgi:hypothetical protein